MDLKSVVIVLALCLAVTMTTFAFEDDLWNVDDLFGEMKETKRGEPLAVAQGMSPFADLMKMRKRGTQRVCIKPETNELCWCDTSLRGERYYLACGLRAVLQSNGED